MTQNQNNSSSPEARVWASFARALGGGPSARRLGSPNARPLARTWRSPKKRPPVRSPQTLADPSPKKDHHTHLPRGPTSSKSPAVLPSNFESQFCVTCLTIDLLIPCFKMSAALRGLTLYFTGQCILWSPQSHPFYLTESGAQNAIFPVSLAMVISPDRLRNRFKGEREIKVRKRK
jgi:hypothetical protein